MRKQLGKYEVVERLGRGGMAEVYRAYHKQLDRYVAIKVLHDFLADDPEFKNRFEKEAQNIARLRHAHIVQVYDFEYDPDTESYFMVMELIDGITLKDRLYEPANQGKPLPLKEALRITREAADALAYAHRSGMIHRDVKPANLMLDPQENDRVVLTDFGIAKLLTSSQFTVTGGLIGTPAYMAPEQGVGESGDERSDLYSLGVIFFQMVTGQLPYEADTPLALILKHLNDPIPSVKTINPTLSPEVDEIIKRVMAKEMNERYQSANELILDIKYLEEDMLDVNDTQRLIDSVTQLNQLTGRSTKNQETAPGLDAKTQQERPTKPYKPIFSDDESTGNDDQRTGAWLTWLLSILLLIGLIGGGYVIGASNGVFPAVAFLASETLTATDIPAPTFTETATATVTETVTNTSTATATASTSPTPTLTETATPSQTPIPEIPAVTEIPTDTMTPTTTNTPTITPNATQTRAAALTATTAACVFDYAIISQEPEDGADGPTVPINTDYMREIVFLNTGTCPWEVNTSLAFIEGESFNAGPRIVIQQEVPVGSEIAVLFEGTTPSRGRLEGGNLVPVEGIWQLRTRGQKDIGEPLIIGVLVFNPGN